MKTTKEQQTICLGNENVKYSVDVPFQHTSSTVGSTQGPEDEESDSLLESDEDEFFDSETLTTITGPSLSLNKIDWNSYREDEADENETQFDGRDDREADSRERVVRSSSYNKNGHKIREENGIFLEKPIVSDYGSESSGSFVDSLTAFSSSTVLVPDNKDALDLFSMMCCETQDTSDLARRFRSHGLNPYLNSRNVDDIRRNSLIDYDDDDDESDTVDEESRADEAKIKTKKASNVSSVYSRDDESTQSSLDKKHYRKTPAAKHYMKASGDMLSQLHSSKSSDGKSISDRSSTSSKRSMRKVLSISVEPEEEKPLCGNKSIQRHAVQPSASHDWHSITTSSVPRYTDSRKKKAEILRNQGLFIDDDDDEDDKYLSTEHRFNPESLERKYEDEKKKDVSSVFRITEKEKNQKSFLSDTKSHDPLKADSGDLVSKSPFKIPQEARMDPQNTLKKMEKPLNHQQTQDKVISASKKQSAFPLRRFASSSSTTNSLYTDENDQLSSNNSSYLKSFRPVTGNKPKGSQPISSSLAIVSQKHHKRVGSTASSFTKASVSKALSVLTSKKQQKMASFRKAISIDTSAEVWYPKPGQSSSMSMSQKLLLEQSQSPQSSAGYNLSPISKEKSTGQLPGSTLDIADLMSTDMSSLSRYTFSQHSQSLFPSVNGQGVAPTFQYCYYDVHLQPGSNIGFKLSDAHYNYNPDMEETRGPVISEINNGGRSLRSKFSSSMSYMKSISDDVNSLESSKLRVGDHIVAIDDTDTTNMKSKDMMKLLKKTRGRRRKITVLSLVKM